MDQVIKQYKESTGKDARVMFIVVAEHNVESWIPIPKILESQR